VYGCTGMQVKSDPNAPRGERWVVRTDGAGRIVPQAYIMDFTSGLERGATVGAVCLVGAAALFWIVTDLQSAAQAPILGATLTVAAVLSLAFRLGIREYRIVDAKSQTIWRHCRVLWRTWLTPECRFEACRRLQLVSRYSVCGVDQGNEYRGHQWHVRLILQFGSAIQLTDETWQDWDERAPVQPPYELLQVGQKLAQILGLRLEVTVW